MNKKRLIAIILTAAGLTGLGVGFHYNHKLNKAASTSGRLLSPFEDNTFGSLLGSSADKKIRSYRIKIHLLLAASAILTAYGASLLITKKES